MISTRVDRCKLLDLVLSSFLLQGKATWIIVENTEYFQTQIKLAENIVKLDDEDIKKTWYSKRPAKLLNYLYLGDCSDANSIGMLTEMGITHALNCAGAERSFFSQFPQYCGNNNAITYKQFDADDFENYDITTHFQESIAYIDEVSRSQWKSLGLL